MCSFKNIYWVSSKCWAVGMQQMSDKYSPCHHGFCILVFPQDLVLSPNYGTFKKSTWEGMCFTQEV